MDTIRYIAQNRQDLLWGLSVCSVGFQKVAAGEEYPPRKHNSEYMFSPSGGRVLSEYQLLYITEGGGSLVTAHSGRHDIKAGTMFLLFPGEWHSYAPDPNSGWHEYWIGFSGSNIDSRVEKNFFSKENPVYEIGYNESIVELYRQAIEVAKRQEAYFQQLLAGIVNHILGLMFMTERKIRLEPDEAGHQLVERAKMLMQESLERDMTMPQLAGELGTSYATFRHGFKKHTGMSPSQYFIGMKIHRAKEILRSSDISIKELSIRLRFENPEYFATLFKKKTGVSPSEFRKR